MENYNMQRGDIVLGHYEVQRIIAEGGEGVVSKGVDLDNGDIVAIKHYNSLNNLKIDRENAINRIIRAAEAKIGHPNVVDCIDYGEDEGEWFTIMPFIEGETLDEFVASHGGRLDIDTANNIISKLADGLREIHSKGFINRDVKPSNIIIDKNLEPHIIDMGICKKVNENTFTDVNGFLGSIQFMSPEQLMNPVAVTQQADLYSLGVVYYYMLTGRFTIPAVNDNRQLLEAIYKIMPPPPSSIYPDIPAHIDNICMKMLAKIVQDRFQSASEVIDALNGKTSPKLLLPASSSNNHSYCNFCGSAVQIPCGFCHNCGAGMASNNIAFCLACGTQTGDSSACTGCGRNFSSSDHRLSFNSGPLAGMICRIPEGEYYIGRNEICQRDYSISRRHLSVRCLNGTVYFTDAGSSNGTFIEGLPAYKPTPLVNNCQVMLSKNTAVYSHI